MAEKEKDIKLVKKVKDNYSKLNMNELLACREAANIVYNYYDNLAKSNMGTYDDFNKKEYEEAKNETVKYSKLVISIFEEIKRRVDTLL